MSMEDRFNAAVNVIRSLPKNGKQKFVRVHFDIMRVNNYLSHWSELKNHEKLCVNFTFDLRVYVFLYSTIS